MTLEDGRGRPLAVLAHVVCHAPGGLVWGPDAGAAGADLARSLLIDALGDEARCPSCSGTQEVVWDEEADAYVAYGPHVHPPGAASPCPHCRAGYGPKVERLYKRFRMAVVAGLPRDRDWQLTRAEVRQWIATHWAKVNR